jgi:uncharacterized membrane protein
MLRLTLAWLHLVALGIGMWAVFARGEALKHAARELPAPDALRRAFRADNHWGVAAVLWLGTGIWRYLGATEKTTDYYNANHVFLTKMALFLLVIVLEVWPARTLMRWRRALRLEGGPQPGGVATTLDAAVARKIATISYVQGAIVTVMILTAVAMARGYGARN